MQVSAFSIPSSKYSKTALENHIWVGARGLEIRLLAGILLALLGAIAVQAWAAPAPKVHRMQSAAATTTTTLNTSSLTVNQRLITALSAAVTDPNTVTQGLVSFYDGKVLLGTAQIVNTGSKYVHGSAYLKVELAAGTHVLKAVFAGTTTDAPSASSTKSVTVTGGATATTISSTGSQGNYTLTGQVVVGGANPATGTVSFLDTSNGNASLGSAALGTATVNHAFAKSAAYSIYDTTDNDRPQQVVVADFNGDGILDLAEIDYSAAISIHMGKGDGTFMAAAPFCTIGNPATECQAGSEPTTIVSGDFNSDGIPDLAVNDGSDVVVFLGDGDGRFQQGVIYATASGNNMIVVGDFNRDGTPDFAVTVDGGVSIVLGNGDGTFQPNNDIPLNDSSTYITVGEFNKDGIQDLAVTGWNGSTFMVLLGNGDGTFKAEKDTAISSNQNPANGTIMAADFKSVGYLCDLAFSGNSAVFEPWLGKGDGTFAAPPASPVYNADGGLDVYAGPLTVADLNGDGIPDIAMAWYTADNVVGRVAVFYGKGDGTFNATPTQLSAGQQPIWIATGDFDGNGMQDLVVANENDSTLSAILNSASTTASAVLSQVLVPGTGTHNVLAQYAGNTAFAGSTSSTIALTAGGTAAVPTITSVSPTSVVAGSGAFTLTVNGTNFATGAVVKWNGSARTTAFVSATKLSAAILTADIATAGNHTVTVTVGAATSTGATFTVTAPVPIPVITSISPNDMPAGSPAFSLSVNGTGFTNGSAGSIVYWNTTKLPTTFFSTTKLTAAVPATDVAAAGSASITVKTGAGTASNALTFTITPAMETVLAMGFFNKTGTPGATSGNITCTWNTSEYLCAITGQTFYYSKYVANVTVADTGAPYIATVNSVGGQVIVKIYNLSGTAVQEPFYITVYKP